MGLRSGSSSSRRAGIQGFRASSKTMLIAKGYGVRFVMEHGSVRPARTHALLHDPSGRVWPKCSGLVSPFRKTGDEINDSTAKSYFGLFSDAPRRGILVMPPRALSEWRFSGYVEEIEYSRFRPDGLRSSHRDDYFHPFKGDALLYRRGGLFRIELGRGCLWNWRGIVRP
jgi:hypothetical protein